MKSDFQKIINLGTEEKMKYLKLRPSIEICRRIFDENIIGVEVGVSWGVNALSILSCWSQIKMLHLVDIYAKTTQKDIEKIKAKFIDFNDRITWHIGSSVEMAKTFNNESLDFVYIDADHSLKAVTIDLNAWFPKVKRTGIICGHDYYNFDSVNLAVNHWAQDNQKDVFYTNPDWWIFKD